MVWSLLVASRLSFDSVGFFSDDYARFADVKQGKSQARDGLSPRGWMRRDYVTQRAWRDWERKWRGWHAQVHGAAYGMAELCALRALHFLPFRVISSSLFSLFLFSHFFN
jgi:hypothetical protein